MTLSYADRVKASAERSRVQSRMGRDIAPLPPILNPQQRLKCRDNLRLFCTTYLGTWFTKEFGAPHLSLIESLEDVLKNGGRKCVALPRGTGKSTIVCASIIWALLNGHRHFIVIIGASAKAAKKFVGLITATLSTPHTPLAADYPEACYPIQCLGGSFVQTRGQHFRGGLTRISMTADQLVLPTIPCSPSSGARLVALGIGSALRGQSAEGADGSILRPDTVLLDDIQVDADSCSPARVEKLCGLVSGVVKGLARSGERLAQIQTLTVIQPDDYADRTLNDPLWNGLRTRALTDMPKNLDAWREYRDVLLERGEQEARAYYLENYAVLTEGASASWPQDYDPAIYTDAIEYNMRLWCEDEKSFWSERQNEPLRPTGLQNILTAPEIATKLSYIPRFKVHENTHKITCGCDIHDDILYYSIVALRNDYTASVCDYGTYPKQQRPYFHRGSGIISLAQTYRGEPASNVLQGLTDLLKRLNEYRFSVEGGGELGIERVLCDSGWRSEIVHEAIRRSGCLAAICCKGVSIGPAQKPMGEWSKKTGRVIGWHCVEERVNGKNLLLIDTNYWKSRLHEALSTPPGKPGELTLFGDDPGAHRMFCDHLVSETPKVMEGENTVICWTPKPSTENHWLDTTTYAYSAGVTLGLRPSDYI